MNDATNKNVKHIYIIKAKTLWAKDGQLVSTKGKISDICKFKTLEEAEEFIKGIEERFYIVERTITTTDKRLDMVREEDE